MRALTILLLIGAAGCGFGYEVDTDAIAQYGADGRNPIAYQTMYRCRHVRPIIWYNYTVAMCATKEECNKICMDLGAKVK